MDRNPRKVAVVNVETLQAPRDYSEREWRAAWLIAYQLERLIGHKCRHIYCLPPDRGTRGPDATR